MNPSKRISGDQAMRLVSERIKVTPLKVIAAKGMIMTYMPLLDIVDSSLAIEKSLASNGIHRKTELVFNWETDLDPDINQLAEALSWYLAGSEAILSLLNSGILIPGESPQRRTALHVMITEPGHKFGHSFSETIVCLPTQVRLAPSQRDGEDQMLSDPDLFLLKLNITNMHTEISSALQEAVKCFRHELFAASIAMVGKASEGAWLELGRSLLKVADLQQIQASSDTKKALAEDSQEGAYKIMNTTLKLYEKPEMSGPLESASRVSPKQLASAFQWSDVVRESRNTIHFGATSAVENTYEKVGTLLIGVIPKMRLLYALKAAADSWK